MNIEAVRTLFSLFSDDEYSQEYEPFIALSLSEVGKMLLPDADEDDARLNFLCAASANYRLQQMKSALGNSEYTYAGKKTGDKYSSFGFAEKMLRDYYQLCSDLIKPQNFTFISFSSKEDL